MASLTCREGRVGAMWVVVVCLCAASPTQATERHVPSEYATIQEAIDACADDDEVVIAPGTYSGSGNRNLRPTANGLTVRSTAPNDPNVVAATAIRPRWKGRAFTINGPSRFVVDGLTLIDGKGGVGGGGAILSTGPVELTIRNCNLVANFSYSDGGALECGEDEASWTTLENCRVAFNLAFSPGGAIRCYSANLTIRNCVVVGNSGGICCVGALPTIENATLAMNWPEAIRVLDQEAVGGPVRNCIIWGNAVDQFAPGTLLDGAVTYCDVQGGCPGEGNVDVDPLLTYDGFLRAGSPCLDLGDPNYVADPNETDVNGEPRVQNGRLDIGSDELLDTDGDGLPDWWEMIHFGSATVADPNADSDADGRADLQEYVLGSDPLTPGHVYVDPNGDDAWDGLAPVWDGEHGPKATIQAAISFCGRNDEVIVAPGRYVRSGDRDLEFAGKAITLRGADPNDPKVVAATVIDAQGVGRAIGFSWFEREDTVVDGLTMTNGYTNFDGGAIRCGPRTSPTIRNCRLVGNGTSRRGGAISCCGAQPTFVNCLIADNHAALGGAVECWASGLELRSCTIVHNSATYEGGAVWGHGALGRGLQMLNCTIAHNTAGTSGGAYFLDGSVDPDAPIFNCIIWGNMPDQLPSSPNNIGLVTYCDVQGGWPGEGNIDVEPLLTVDWHLKGTSPCVDQGDPNYQPELGEVDRDLDPRVFNDRLDIGPDEFYDTDGDGLQDWWELKYFGSPTVAEPNGDPDHDTRTNVQEYHINSNPLENNTKYVSPDGSDAWDGEAATWDGAHGPKATIQAAIDLCIGGDEVIIAPGRYSGAGNYDLDYGGRGITVRSTNPNDPNVVAVTFIDPRHAGRGFVFDDGEDPNAVLAGLTVTRAYASGNGAAVCCDAQSNPTIRSCVFIKNHAVKNGGALYAGGSSSPALVNCFATRNHADWAGGAIYCDASELTLRGCTVVDNTADDFAGGIGIGEGSSSTVTNCTVVGNCAGYTGGGLYYCGDSAGTVTNSIVAGNSADKGPEIGLRTRSHPSSVAISYSAVQGGPNEVSVDPNCTLTWGVGNIDSDPHVTRDGHLQAGSPCLDLGDPNYVAGDDETDMDAEARVMNGRIDIGADEFFDTDADGLPDYWERKHFGNETAGDPNADSDGDGRDNLQEYVHGSNPLRDGNKYVDVGGSDDWDGLTPVWDGQHGPKATIQEAIDTADLAEPHCAVVNVAPGAYTGDGNRDLNLEGEAIVVRGTNPNDPNVVAATIIDCGGTALDPHRGFVFKMDEGPAAVVAGLTIANGYAAGSGSEMDGGGILCNGSAPTILNCVIDGCTAEGDGGGICCTGGTGPAITHCTLSGNTAGGYGGAVACSASNAAISCCMINECTAGTGGGAIYCDGSDLSVTGCVITGGSSAGNGGGILCDSDSNPTINGCTITGASADTDGGGICCIGCSAAVIADSEIAGCSADQDGGGVRCTDSGGTITRCAVTANSAGRNGGGVCCTDSDLEVSRSAIKGNSSGYHGGGVYCLSGSASLKSCVITDNLAPHSRGRGGGLYAGSASSAILNCTLARNTSSLYGGGVYLSYGSATFRSCIIWQNACPTAANIGFFWEGTFAVSYSDVQGGPNEVYVDPGCTLDWLDGSIDADPCFLDPNGPDGDPATWQDNDYHIAPGSPCVDAGDPNGDHTGQTDIDGQDRTYGRVDMGADEVWPDVTYVLDLKVVNACRDDIAFDPEPDDPNLPTYAAGTVVTLTAIPSEQRTFERWEIFDPNYPGDANYTTTDSNDTITLLMEADQKVRAVHACGSGKVLPLMMIGLVALAVRRRGR